MKNTKLCLILSIILLSFKFVSAQSPCDKGSVMESLSVKSKILGHDIKYSVYLPSDYNSSNRSYPVLYLLHGYSDNETSWIQFGEVNLTADRLIKNGEASSMIIVMPDAGLTWYINSYNDSVRYEDAFFSEFIPTIEKTYRIRAKKEFRAIGGLSMGGYGSMLYALKHPDMFVACLPFSAAIRNDSLMIKRLKLGESNSIVCYGKLKGYNLPETWKKNSILDLADSLPLSQLNSVKYYIDCGDKDNLLFGNSLLHMVLMYRDVPHEFRVRGGRHEWTYWRQSIEDGLKFVSVQFSR
jgi:S-formylglutathione hydrolase FrmB